MMYGKIRRINSVRYGSNQITKRRDMNIVNETKN